MAINIDSSNFAQILSKETNCIAVCRNEKYHVRQYSRNIRNGKSHFWMVVYCHYANMPIKYKELFGIK